MLVRDSTNNKVTMCRWFFRSYRFVKYCCSFMLFYVCVTALCKMYDCPFAV